MMRPLILPALLFTAAGLACCSGECKYKVFKEASSPSGNHRVLKFYNWCGSTSSNNINLSVLGKGDSVENRDKIFFVAGSKVGDELDRDTTVSFHWLNDSTIMVEYYKDIVILQKEMKQDSIHIEYREK